MTTRCSQQVRQCRRGFTLVELLVVIGIIAVLISILLPALSAARRQAAVVQCASNMRQMSLGLIMYINAHKGKHPPATISAGGPHNVPNGFWWPNELVRGGYIKAPSVYPGPGSPTTAKRFNKSNVFRCPEGIEEEFTFGSFGGHEYPTSFGNNRYTITNDAAGAADGLAIPSWYMLNSRNGSRPTNEWPHGIRQAPFMGFQSGNTDADFADPKFQRHSGQVKKASELVMIIEASNNNWHDQANGQYNGAALTGDSVCRLRRLAARHGKKTKDGLNAFTNFAFFDGHVALFPTKDFQKNAAGTDNMVTTMTQGTIFCLKQQKPL